MDQVILVDPNDTPIGTMEKMEAHVKGVLHRAFSILLFNSKGEILLQKRASTKYHSGSLWTNTCCSHPHPEESMEEALHRKLFQEMGIRDITLAYSYKFIYKTALEKGLVEHECDYVFIGQFDGVPVANPDEVEDWKYQDLTSLRIDVQKNPANYTEWFKLILHHPEFKALPV